MKKLLFLFLFLAITSVHAQETTLKIKLIDSLVSAINYSKNYFTKKDSTILDMPSMKMYMRTYETTVMDGRDLKKFTRNVRTRSEEHEKQKLLITSTIFYYSSGQLIKIEEHLAQDSSQAIKLEWYYKNNELFNTKAQPPLDDKQKLAKVDDRGKMLIIMAEEVKKNAESKVPKM